MKSMRAACSGWQQGFECSVRKLRICGEGPPFPFDGSFSQRFSGLVSLDLGSSFLVDDDDDLKHLAGLHSLQTLILGQNIKRWEKLGEGEPLQYRLKGFGLKHLPGLSRLQRLVLRGCRLVGDEDLKNLRGLALTSLDIGGCHGLRGPGLQYLQGLPLSDLTLFYCSQLETLGGLRGLPLTTLDLQGCNSIQSLESLHGMSLTSLDLSACGKLIDLNIAHLSGLPLRYLNLQDCMQLTDTCIEFLSGMPLSDLNITWCVAMTGRSLELLQGLPITKLSLIQCNVNDADFRFLAALPLTCLELGGSRNVNRFTGEGFSYFAGRQIQDLYILGCPHLRSENLRHLSVFPLTKLFLDLDSFRGHLDDSGMGFLRKLSMLRDLTLYDCKALTDQGLSHVRGLQCTSLRIENFDKLTDLGLKYLIGMPLKTLRLCDCLLLTDRSLEVLLSFTQ